MPSTNVAPVVLSSLDSPDPISVESVSSRGNVKSPDVKISEAPNVPPVEISTSDGPTTNADRCKKHRCKLGDEYREANKLRMRKARME